MERVAESAKQHEPSPAVAGHGHAASPAAAPLPPALELQQLAGNQAMQELLRSGFLQAKLAISNPDDPEEREADNIAHTIMRKSAGAPCSCSPGEEMCEECQQKQSAPSIQRHASSPPVPAHIPRIVSDVLRSPGHPLDSATRAFFEPRFGRDFSDVRVHTGADAAASARSIHAHAYTAGSDIVFASGQYSPDTSSGRSILGHELTHVIQQSSDGANASLEHDFRLAGVPENSGTVKTGQLRTLNDPVIQRERDDRPSADLGVAPPTSVPKTTPGPPIPTGDQPQSNDNEPPNLWLDETRPWLADVLGSPNDLAIAKELYDDPSVPVIHEPLDLVESLFPQPLDRVQLIPELLAPRYQRDFYNRMDNRLNLDVASVQETLRRGANSKDVSALLGTIDRWSDHRDLRLLSGQSYFDAFLSRLRNESGIPPYLLFKGQPTPYLDMLFDQVKERAGELAAILARSSVEFGAYRPEWIGLSPTGVPTSTEAPPPLSQELKTRITNRILEALTTEAENEPESRFVVDSLSGLPSPALADVLKTIASHYGDSGFILARFGEVSETGMLYRLFELLTKSDRLRLGEVFKNSGLFKTEAVDSLVEGRPFGARYFPYTTQKGQEAAEYWAGVANRSSGVGKVGAVTGGLFSSLWLPETAGTTVATLSAAKFAPQVAQIHPYVGGTLAVLGTGASAFTATIAIQDLATGRDSFTNKPLDEGEKIARVLDLISSALFLAAGFMEAAKIQASGGLVPYRGGIAPGEPTPGAPPPPVWEVANPQFNPDTGEASALIRHLPTDAVFDLRYNPVTGNGTFTNVETGEQLPIVGGRLQPPVSGLIGAGEPVEAPLAGEDVGVGQPSGIGSTPIEGEQLIPAPTTAEQQPVGPTAEPRRLPPGPQLTYTLRKVQSLRGPAKGPAGETYVAEVYRGQRGASYVTPVGGRNVDVEALLRADTPSHLEVKAYSRWRTVRGVPVEQSVPLKPEIQAQIDKDTYLKARVPGYDPVWLFLDAPPSQELAEMLAARRIGSVVYGRAPSPKPR